MKFLQPLFSLLGVDYSQFRALLKTHIQLDFRSHRMKETTQTSQKKRSFILTLIFYLLPSLMIAVFGVQRSDLFGFSFITIALSMIFIALSIIIEFNEIIINPEDSEILTFRPISSRTYFYVKMANLFFYVTVIGAALNVPPAFIGLGLPEANWTFPIIYLIVGWLTQITVASFVIILYSQLVKIFNYEKLKDILAYVQMIFTFIIFIGYQFLIRLTSKFEGQINFKANWNFLAPPAWFGSVVSILSGSFNFNLFILALLAFAFTLVTLTFAFRNLSLDYAQMIYKLSETAKLSEKQTPKTEERRGFSFSLKYLLIKNPLQLAGYDLVSKYLRRSRTMRTRIYPSFAMPLVFIALFIMDGEFQDPFLPGAGFGTFLPLLFLIWVAVFFYQIVPTSDDWKASWIYYVSPIENYAQIYWGSMKAIVIKYITPYFLFVFIVLSFLIPILHSLLICLFNYFFFIAFYIFMTLFLKDLPLSKKYERGQSNTRFMTMFILAPLFGFGFVLEYFVFQNPIFIPVGILLLILLAVFFLKIAGRRFNEQIQKREFIY